MTMILFRKDDEENPIKVKVLPGNPGKREAMEDICCGTCSAFLQGQTEKCW